MAIKDVLDEIKKLSPEDRAALREAFGPAPEAAKPAEPEREKHAPEAAKAAPVFFFRQLFVYADTTIKRDGEKLKKMATQLPSRIIAVDEKAAAKLFWKGRGKYEYLGRSDGKTWRAARLAGKRVGEAQAMEYDAMMKNPDKTPPESREKTFFAGTKPGTIARGDQIAWSQGLKQRGGG